MNNYKRNPYRCRKQSALLLKQIFKVVVHQITEKHITSSIPDYKNFQDRNILHNSRFFMKMFHCEVLFFGMPIYNIINEMPWSTDIIPHLWQLLSFAFSSYQVLVFAFSPNYRVKTSDNNCSSNQTESHKLKVVTFAKFEPQRILFNTHRNMLLSMVKIAENTYVPR